MKFYKVLRYTINGVLYTQIENKVTGKIGFDVNNLYPYGWKELHMEKGLVL